MKFAYGTPEKLIEAFIGAWGVKTGSITPTLLKLR